MTAKVQTGVTNPVPAVSPANNQFTGSSYDLNGNMISGVGATLGYDEANRLSSVAPTSGGTGYYGYAPDNKRIYQALPSRYGMQEAWTFYGAHGEKLGVYQWFDVRGDGTCTGGCGVQPRTWNVWFGGKMIYEGGSSVYEVGTAAGATYHDRVGTNRANGARFYPYGDQIGGTSNDHEKFGTYQRDGFTGLDYADQRYYASSYGRFATADQYMASANGANDPSTPVSWDKYSYVLGDPVNGLDPTGMFFVAPSDPGGSTCTFVPWACSPWGNGPTYNSGGGGGGSVGNAGGVNTNPAATAAVANQYLNSVWSNCAAQFAKIQNFNLQNFEKVISGINWINATNPNIASQPVSNYGVLGYGQETVAQYMAATSDDAFVQTGTNNVIVGSLYFTSLTQTQQIAVAIHEALHIYLAPLGDDYSIMAWINSVSNAGLNVNGGSYQITNWIVGGGSMSSTGSGGCTGKGP